MNKRMLIALMIIIFIVAIISPLLLNDSSRLVSKFNTSFDKYGAFLQYFGSILGGLITLCGVILTLRHNEEMERKAAIDNFELAMEQSRWERLPFLVFEICQIDLKSMPRNTSVITLEEPNIDTSSEDDYIELALQFKYHNEGIGIAKNFKVQILNDSSNSSSIVLNNYAIEIKKEYEDYLKIRCHNNCFNTNWMEFKIIIEYEDIIDNTYRQTFKCDINKYIIYGVEQNNCGVAASVNVEGNPTLINDLIENKLKLLRRRKEIQDLHKKFEDDFYKHHNENLNKVLNKNEGNFACAGGATISDV